jgi:alpha-galactosidase
MKNLIKQLSALTLAVLAIQAVSSPAQQAAQTNAPEDLSKMILTPKEPPTPRINGPKVFGVRPGNPFLFTIPATGNRPMTFAADKLPAGLKLDPKTGLITGVLKDKGEHTVVLHAKNSLGEAKRDLKIVAGSTIGLTPALGWNSWNCFGPAVTAENVQAAADAMVAKGLVNHGWIYINTDDYWEQNPRGMARDPSLGGPGRDAEGRIVPNPRFPDMKGLVDHIHGLGLKAGIYSGPGPTTCGGCIASYQHEAQDVKSYTDWGFDYLKYDWCSYSQIANAEATARFAATNTAPPVTNTVAAVTDTNQPGGTNAPARRGGRGRGGPPLIHDEHVKPYRLMGELLTKAPRDMIFSLCQYGNDKVWEWGAEVDGNSWRTTGDITDNWGSLSRNGFRLGGHEKYVSPGHFDDPDMLIVGTLSVASGRNLHPTRLTADEQYTHISLWCLLASPLLIGCDMTKLDDFTLNLLCNDEVLDVDQDPLGRQASRIVQDTEKLVEIWAKPMEDGSRAVGLFNRSEEDTTITVKWADFANSPMTDLKVSGKQAVRDLWRQKDLGTSDGEFSAKVPKHGVVLVKLSPAK